MRTKHKQKNFDKGKNKSGITVVESSDTLLSYLFKTYSDRSKTTVKSWLSHRQVAINGNPETAFDAPLMPGDKVLINFEKGFKEFKNNRIKIVYEDDYIIVANKGYGLLSVSSDRVKENTAFRILSDYLKEDNPFAKLFVIHRLDRDTSGLIMYAKSEEVQFKLQRSWNEMVLDRRYVAVIHGALEPAEGEISSYLTENSVHHVYSTTDKEIGQFALTKYKTLQSNSRYSLVELQLSTGRKNQIRVHMSESGHPIAGDKRYGSKDNPLGRLSLHAFRLRFVHPITRQDMLFETPLPPQFVKVTR
ncbi:MAG: RluA family pseudouridine synthase [Bacteroidales bacterium]|nr:RluA family pseudouridine synthase [Bacteroidales bacterium]